MLRLHPDLHPEQPASAIRLWHRVQQAYRAGDMQELRALWLMVCHHADYSGLPEDPALDQLEAARDALQSRIDALLKRIEDVEGSFPSTWSGISLTQPGLRHVRRR